MARVQVARMARCASFEYIVFAQSKITRSSKYEHKEISNVLLAVTRNVWSINKLKYSKFAHRPMDHQLELLVCVFY